MLRKYFIAAVLVLHPIIAKSSELSSPLAGFYLDTFTGLSARGGYAFVVHTARENERTIDRISFFLFPDAELGTNAQKLSVGVGMISGVAVARAGLSYARSGSQEYLGLDIVGSFIGLSLKLGFYQEKGTEDSLATLGFGLGF